MKRKEMSPAKIEDDKVSERKTKKAAQDTSMESKQKSEKTSTEKKTDKQPSKTTTEFMPAKSLLKKDTIFDSITESTTEFHPIFDALAEEIINNSVLMVCGTPLRFREIEFYVNHPNHPDKYTHSDEDQKRAGCWYFHKTGKSFKGGTYKGLDISIGGKTYYGGILIRSLFDKGAGKVIEGSCLCVDHIIKIIKTKYSAIDSIAGIVSYKSYSEKVLDNTGLIYIEKLPDKEEKYKYYKGPRVGLGPKYPEYLNKLYRYVVLPAKIKKGKDTLVKAMMEQGIDKREIQSLTSSTLAYLDKILAEGTKSKK